MIKKKKLLGKQEKGNFLKNKSRDFPGGPVVKTLCSYYRGQGQGTRSLMLQLKKSCMQQQR